MTPLTPEQRMLEEIAGILDDFYAPIARSIDGGKKVNEDDLEPMQTCMAKLMDVWFRLRPGSSNVGIIRAAAESRRNKG